MTWLCHTCLLIGWGHLDTPTLWRPRLILYSTGHRFLLECLLFILDGCVCPQEKFLTLEIIVCSWWGSVTQFFMVAGCWDTGPWSKMKKPGSEGERSQKVPGMTITTMLLWPIYGVSHQQCSRVDCAIFFCLLLLRVLVSCSHTCLFDWVSFPMLLHFWLLSISGI